MTPCSISITSNKNKNRGQNQKGTAWESLGEHGLCFAFCARVSAQLRTLLSYKPLEPKGFKGSLKVDYTVPLNGFGMI